MVVWLIQPNQCFLQILQRHLQLNVCSLSLDPKHGKALNMSWTWQLLNSYRKTDRIHAASAYVQSINLLVQVWKCSIMMSFISRMFLNLQVNLILNVIMQAAGILGRCKEIDEMINYAVYILWLIVVMKSHRKVVGVHLSLHFIGQNICCGILLKSFDRTNQENRCMQYFKTVWEWIRKVFCMKTACGKWNLLPFKMKQRNMVLCWTA